MLKFYRRASIVCLLAILTGCAGQQSDVTRQPDSILPTDQPSQSQTLESKTESQSKDAQVPEKTSKPETLKSQPTTPQEKVATNKENVAAAKEKATPAEKEVLQEELKTLPELSTQEKELVTQVTKTVQSDTPVSKENPGLVTVNRLLFAQEAMWMFSGGSFSTDFEALEPNLSAETDDYQFTITQGDETQAVIQAIAKTDKLHSFTGAAVAVPTKVPQSAMCRTKIPSKTPPQAPTIKNGQAICANDGVLVEG